MLLAHAPHLGHAELSSRPLVLLELYDMHIRT